MGLQLTLLGGFSARPDAGPPPKFPTRKAEAVLAILAAKPGLPHTRERLAALLWPNSGDEQARGSLRQTLAQLRKAIGGHGVTGIVTAGDGVYLDPAGITVDVAAFEAAVAAGAPEDLAQAAALSHRRAGELDAEIGVAQLGLGQADLHERIGIVGVQRQGSVQMLLRRRELAAVEQDLAENALGDMVGLVEGDGLLGILVGKLLILDPLVPGLAAPFIEMGLGNAGIGARVVGIDSERAQEKRARLGIALERAAAQAASTHVMRTGITALPHCRTSRCVAMTKRSNWRGWRRT